MPRAANASQPERPHPAVRGRAEFHRITRTGTRRRGGPLVVISAPGTSGRARVGLVVGRRIGNAVRRNRARRRLRAAMATIDLPAGHDYVVIGSRELLDAPFPEVVSWLRQALELRS